MCHGHAFHGKSAYGDNKYMHGGWARWGRHFGNQFQGPGRFSPPVNVKEWDDRFELMLYAPGLAKEDFQIRLKDDLLVISCPAKDNELVDSPNWRRQEYRLGGFERSFLLNESVDTANISATYAEGVLQVTLPKLAGFETKNQDIYVS